MVRPSDNDDVGVPRAAGNNNNNKNQDEAPSRQGLLSKAATTARASDDARRSDDAAAASASVAVAAPPPPPSQPTPTRPPAPSTATAAAGPQPSPPSRRYAQRRSAAATLASAALALLLTLPVLAAVLVHLPWEPRTVEAGGVDFGFAHDPRPTPDSGPRLDHPLWVREVVTFPAVDGTPLEGWAYLPRRGGGGGGGGEQKQALAPVVIIGQGLGAQKDMGLPAYSEGFAAAGLATFAFDYRGFGGSGGATRHWVDPRRHLQDWRSAVEFVASGGLERDANVSRHLAGLSLSLESSRVGLWGMSYSGGHVLVTAATPGLGADTGGPVRAVVSNEPFLTGRDALARAPLERGVLRVLRLAAAAASDLLRRALGLPAVYVRLAAPLSEPNALALLSLKDSDLLAQKKMAAQRAAQQARADALLAGASAEAAERAADEASARVHSATHRPLRQGGWKNVVAARFLYAMIGYEPLASVPNVKVPLFLRVATADHICPPEIAEKAARLYAGDELVVFRHNVTHIEGLVEGARPSQLRVVVDFYRRHLVGGEEKGAGVVEEEEEDVLEAVTEEAA